MHDDHTHIEMMEMTPELLGQRLTDDLSVGGGIVEGFDGEMVDVFAINVMTLDGVKHNILLGDDLTKFLLMHLIKYAEGRTGREEGQHGDD